MADVTGRGSNRTVTASTTSGSAALTAPAGTFDPTSDVGRPVSGPGIPAGATLSAVASATAATLSANATATGANVSLRLGVHGDLNARLDSEQALGFRGWSPESPAETQTYRHDYEAAEGPDGPGHNEPSRITSPFQMRERRNRRQV